MIINLLIIKKLYLKNKKTFTLKLETDHPIIRVALNSRNIQRLTFLLKRYIPAPVHHFDADVYVNMSDCKLVLQESPPDKAFVQYAPNLSLVFSQFVLGHIYSFTLKLKNIKKIKSITATVIQQTGPRINYDKAVTGSELEYSQDLTYPNTLSQLRISIIETGNDFSADIESFVVHGFYFHD